MKEPIRYHEGRFWRGSTPLFLVAAEYQYYRDRRSNWDDRLEKLKATGLNTITFYIPWRHHLLLEDGRRVFDFTGRTKDSRDVLGFMDRIRRLGLLMIAKPGPFVHSELNVGGLPDIVSPTWGARIPPARRHDGEPAVWSYDDSVLPAPLDPTFDDLAKEWLEAAGDLLRPFAADGEPLIALQLNDETIYCTSNDPPWQMGYEASGLDFYRELVAARYGDIAMYNRLHATSYETFSEIPGPSIERKKLPAADTAEIGPTRREDLLQYVDWAEYQWRLRRDLYLRYRKYVGIDLPYLTNFAGITPPIEENIPGKTGGPGQETPRPPCDHSHLYPEWWFAMNRVDQDADAYHYGMISWLGVAAYDRDVFDRYVNTASRRAGINMEENWGFGALYDARSRHPVVPFFQTLVSIAGGATGYVVFVGAGSDYWDDSLDRITKLQSSTFPSHAPINAQGECTPMYFAQEMLNRWFVANGSALLECRREVDAAYLVYAPYAAVSSWVPDEGYWRLDAHAPPRCGREGFEEFSRSLQEAGYATRAIELTAAPGRERELTEALRAFRAVAIHCAFFMDAPEQETLARLIEDGGRVFLSGELPEVDLRWNPCTRLRDAVEDALRDGRRRVVYRRENLFRSGDFATLLAEHGVAPRIASSRHLRAFVYRGEGGRSRFLFFFALDGGGRKWIEVDGERIDLDLGSRSCGVLRIRDGRVVAWLVKGVNEVEGQEARVRIQLGEQVIAGEGDFCWSGTSAASNGPRRSG